MNISFWSPFLGAYWTVRFMCQECYFKEWLNLGFVKVFKSSDGFNGFELFGIFIHEFYEYFDNCNLNKNRIIHLEYQVLYKTSGFWKIFREGISKIHLPTYEFLYMGEKIPLYLPPTFNFWLIMWWLPFTISITL